MFEHILKLLFECSYIYGLTVQFFVFTATPVVSLGKTLLNGY